MFFNLKVIILLFVAIAHFGVQSYPYYEDVEAAASGGHGHGRVQIKVYRGPSEHEHFAPWGYWVKQPHDDQH